MTTNNRVAMVHCVHHKPWLIMSTLISTAMQNFQDFDTYFLFNKGNGERYYTEYESLYNEYDLLATQFGKNVHLDDPFDDRLLRACRIERKNIYEITYEDDHGLDSGAWYKFIRSRLWRDYDYVFFMGEGTLLTGPSVLGDTIQFSTENDAHFITGSNHKRYLPRSWFSNRHLSSRPRTRLDQFSDRMLAETYSVFSRDPEFQKAMDSWTDISDPVDRPQEHHIPDIWGRYGLPVERAIQRFPSLRSFHNRYLRCRNSVGISLTNRGPFKFPHNGAPGSRICVNFKLRNLSDVVDFHTCGQTNFHKSKQIGWYGTYCNHFIRTTLLEQLARKLDDHKIHDAMKLPYSASALEPIWGLIPTWLGHDLWFFDGIHRVFKNFWTYVREDTQEGMARYLNHHYKESLSIWNEGDYLKIHSFSNAYKMRLSTLNDLYFKKPMQ